MNHPVLRRSEEHRLTYAMNCAERAFGRVIKR